MTALRIDGPRLQTVSVVVPTRNEAGNISALVRRLDAAFGAACLEIIFVDDSEDATPQRIEEVAAWSPRRVRLLHRSEGARAGGLGSAVLAGLRMCESEWAVVMDGDLQHPPEIIPDLIATGDRTGADVVVGSRYVGDGSATGLGSVGRWAVSSGATTMTKAVFPRRLHGCSDPMSGLFAVRLAALDLDRMRPNGFKILLEILARSPHLQLHEHPFSFGVRHSGESKASWREALLLARRLGALRLATLLGPRQLTVAGFVAVGLSGIVVNSLMLWALVSLLGIPVLAGAALATQVSTTWNFLLTDRLVYPGPKQRRALVRYAAFSAVNNLALLARLPLLSLLVHQAGVPYLTANAITLAAAFVVRFALSDRLVFTRRNPMTKTLRTAADAVPHSGPEVAARVPAQRRSGPVDLLIDLRDGALPPVHHRPAVTTWLYDVHGIVRIDSAVRLPELETFRTV
ncbi:MAG: Dolichyl-phosphate beta-D-mannosyltransferase, partial [Frankiales bacterium]|nr:Dolichyl-phosphate beta-D-mannosyltransferase [Frankiales bacterium]